MNPKKNKEGYADPTAYLGIKEAEKDKNACKTCEFYIKCGKPERSMRCMGYKQKERR